MSRSTEAGTRDTGSGSGAAARSRPGGAPPAGPAAGDVDPARPVAGAEAEQRATTSPLSAATEVLRRRGGMPLEVAKGVKRGTLATLSRAEELADPVLRPAVAAVARVRGGPTPEALLENLRAGRHITGHRWGRLGWTAPRRRAVIPIDDQRYVPKTPARLLRQGRFTITTDQAFPDVLHHCATVQGRSTSGRPWLVPEVQDVYRSLHELGHAHSVEVWRGDELVGGELGVAVGGFYSGDSVFFLESNAGKVALAWLTGHLQERGFVLLDTLMVTRLSKQFGAHEIPRAEYRTRLQAALEVDVSFS